MVRLMDDDDTPIDTVAVVVHPRSGDFAPRAIAEGMADGASELGEVYSPVLSYIDDILAHIRPWRDMLAPG